MKQKLTKNKHLWNEGNIVKEGKITLISISSFPKRIYTGLENFVRFPDSCHVEKQPVAWKEYCAVNQSIKPKAISETVLLRSIKIRRFW